MQHFKVLLLFTLFISCASNSNESNIYNLTYHGALKNIMRKGDLSAYANLEDLQNTKNVYALGAVENLKGEILVLDGIPYVSIVQNDSLTINKNFDHKATLLVQAEVERWQTVTIPDHISSYEDFEVYVEEAAKTIGINTKDPFPFMIEGIAKSFDWHVIDWPEGDTEHTHEKHISSGHHGTIKDRDIEVLGFYSDRHHAIFTHHTTNLHMHVKTKDDQLAGHMDDIQLGEGMILKLPEIK